MAYTALHYGKEYLAWAIRSVQDHVDEFHVLYTPKPSFGFTTSDPCPETEEELKAEAHRFLKKPLIWHTGNWGVECNHRNSILPIAAERKVDTILVLDADELWDGETLEESFAVVEKMEERNILVRFTHFWRSFHWHCPDGAMPVRFIKLNGKEVARGISPQKHPVLHFGYAQSSKVVGYKTSIHGHRAEWREGWFENKFMAWGRDQSVKDVHPTNVNFWNPQPVPDDLKVVVDRVASDHPWVDGRIIA